MFAITKADQQVLNSRGITVQQIQRQLKTFQEGIPYITLDRPCTINDGITRFSSDALDSYVNIFQDALSAGRVTKFVPASGAASRMFKPLLTALEEHQEEKTPIALEKFFHQLDAFPFYTDLQAQLADQRIKPKAQQWKAVLQTLLYSPGLNYSNLPKGLLKFHHYPDHTCTPIEEHIAEGCVYAQDASRTVRIHFTISPDHETLVQEHLKQIRHRIESQHVRLTITLSHQSSSTDTIAVDPENRLFRDSRGTLVFRPGGHGALLQNLHNLQGDIVFIKNIDNVVPQQLADQPNRYKMALGGYLASLQGQLFQHLNTLSQEVITDKQLQDIANFAAHTFGITLSQKEAQQSVRTQHHLLFERLNRPIRVCGMVPNTGEPGGGPFWVTHPDGSHSLQIVEASQVDPHSGDQQAILKSSTHFNPVDLVCGVRNFQGHPFDLPRFTNPETGFISMKSYHGRDLKALELPGLWNGAMALWNTLFVEVPASTFNPVKTVFDLLRPEHHVP